MKFASTDKVKATKTEAKRLLLIENFQSSEVDKAN